MRELMTAFGMPVVIDVGFAAAPADLAWLREGAVGAAVERRADQWQVTLPRGASVAAADAVIHDIIERTIAGGGRLRKIGVAEPALDELFARYVLDRRPGGKERAVA
jgi:hypothetical protein